jgi:uncharacterized membrane protein
MAVTLAALYLLGHDIGKFLPVAALLRNQLWPYAWTIGLLTLLSWRRLWCGG